MLLNNGRLSCSCGDPTFTGIPCRHLLALVCKVKHISYENLVFNPRWKKDYFIESVQEPDELEEIKKDEEEEGKEEKSVLEGDVSYISENDEERINLNSNGVSY